MCAFLGSAGVPVMRIAAALALAVALTLAPAAMAQQDPRTVRAETAQLAQAAASPMLDGSWQMQGAPFGRLVLATQADGSLQGTFVAAPCHGSHRDNHFVVLCYHNEIGTYIFSGEARETPLVA